jgi:hypothetical protein
MVLSTIEVFAGLDKDNPYQDKAQTTKGTVKLESMIVIISKNAVQK